MPKPKTHGRPHSRTGSSTSVVKLSALTPAHRSDSAQRIVHQPLQPPTTQQPPKKPKHNGKPHTQILLQQPPAQRRPATPPNTHARRAIESPSGNTEDEWESSESTTVTPNPELADDGDAVADDRPTPVPANPDVTTPRFEDEPGPATPKQSQKPPLLDMNAAAAAAAQQRLQLQQSTNPSSGSQSARQPPAQQMPALLASPAIVPASATLAEHPIKKTGRPRPHSAIFPAGAGMTPLVPSRRDSHDGDESAKARHRHSISAQHRFSLNMQPGSGASSPSRPMSMHSIAGIPSRPHPLLRGLSHSGVASSTVEPLLTSDSATATLSPNPSASMSGSQPASPNSQTSRTNASSAMSIGGRLFRRPSTSSIRSVATLPATSVTALSTSPSTSSTGVKATGTFGRARTPSTASSSAALSSLAQAQAATGRVASPPPIWKTSIVFGGQIPHHHHPEGGGAFALLQPEVRAQHAAVATWHAPGLTSFERVVAQRIARTKPRAQ
ncbi:hypothetical protein EXIGLDRAFT_725455 [Exidia glandulosa HHB12029]|uniref:Uncharacterized protein n=1 Tax=Exidia glandulosa HHB12029 TaxID=1314781 RepID=A0A165E1U6_EXIGL|nr:hypothetical protein EXIGLDRAFT_725455 [Exidia glandulosa HHB12029]